MKVALYNQHSGGGIGGSELSLAVLASALSREHEVEIVHHVDRLTPDRLASRAGVTLPRVTLRRLPPVPFAYQYAINPLKRFRNARRWLEDLSEPYDVFVDFTHDVPPFCHAPRGVLMVLFPFAERPSFRVDETSPADRAWAALNRLYDRVEWTQRLGSYGATLANSEFTRAWTRRRWGIDCAVVYPPVDESFADVEKENLILSVGRFATEGHSKKQAELVRLFADARRSALAEWEYVSAGDLGTSPDDRAYFDEVCGLARDAGVRILANVERTELRRLHERAKIFWHGAGLGEDEDAHPEAVEHFGVATVEAMAAGCVPIVVGKGGQREVVDHGVSGFLWETPDELLEFTRALASDDDLFRRMSAEARLRARRFSRDRYVERMLGLCVGA